MYEPAESADHAQDPFEDDDFDEAEQNGKPADPNQTDAAAGEDTHRSLRLTPSPFHPDRSRPRAVIYVHFSEEALSAGRGVARVEDVGPVVLGRLSMLLDDKCSISLKPVIDLPAGHIPVDSYETPTRLRDPADMFPHRGEPPHRP